MTDTTGIALEVWDKDIIGNDFLVSFSLYFFSFQRRQFTFILKGCYTWTWSQFIEKIPFGEKMELELKEREEGKKVGVKGKLFVTLTHKSK